MAPPPPTKATIIRLLNEAHTVMTLEDSCIRPTQDHDVPATFNDANVLAEAIRHVSAWSDEHTYVTVPMVTWWWLSVTLCMVVVFLRDARTIEARAAMVCAILSTLDIMFEVIHRFIRHRKVDRLLTSMDKTLRAIRAAAGADAA